MKRIAITFFFDDAGVVDEYMYYLVASLKPFVERNVFVSNGPVNQDAQRRIKELGCELIERDNIGFDVWAYKAGIEHIGYENLGCYDELILLNHTFYGPIFPFSEMFEAMEKRTCDFWGLTAHKEMIPNPFTNEGILPRHLNSHFIVARGAMLHSQVFADYWRQMPMIESYVDSVLRHESRFTKYFIDLGYICSVYDDDEAYPSKYPCFINVDQAVERRCPILKRRIFFHDSIFLEQNAIDLPRALRIMRETSDYDESLIWKNILRTANSRTLNTNAGLTKIMPTEYLGPLSSAAKHLRVAVCAHVYYVDLLDETLDYAANIPIPFDVIITTSDDAKKKEIEKRLAERAGVTQAYVLVVEQNRGRDMSSLFISCRDFFLEDRYDLVLRLHTKKSPQVEGGRGQLFKRHMLENLAGSQGLVSGVLELFAQKPWLGLSVPPVVHISFPTLGNAWFANKPAALEVAKMLDLHIKFDASTPVAAYGTMFWFRPKALRKLFAHNWAWEDFNAEPHHVDGGMAHVLERLIGYTAQDAGYITMQILSEHQAAYNYAMLEYKLERISSFMPWTLPWQFQMLELWKKAEYPTGPVDEAETYAKSRLLNELRKPKSDHGNVVIQRLSAESYNLLHSILGGDPIDPGEGASYRPDLRHVRELRIEQLMEKCGLGHQIMRSLKRNLNKSISPQAQEVRDNVELVNSFLAEVRGDVGRGVEKTVREREILDYLFFSWPEGHELIHLFDSRNYAARYLATERAMTPFTHYLSTGAKRLHDPHPLFDATYYASQVKGRTLNNPLVDYWTRGWKDGLSPHPLFEVPYYLENNRDVAAHHMEPLSHFLLYGAKEGRSPHWAFDTAFYLEKNPEVEISGFNPLIHFLQQGHQKNCWPNNSFDPTSYVSHFPELEKTKENPLVHYVREVRARLREVQAVNESSPPYLNNLVR